MSLLDDTPIRPAKFEAGEAKYTLTIDSTQAGVEDKYFWILRFLENRQPYGRDYTGDIGEIIKTKDIYTAGETSAYWGSVEQKRAAQIDKFQQLMANVGTMTKTLFQLLRELRIMDERLEYYDRSAKGEEPAEVALKSIWVDMVEGGAKNPGSVYGLATTVGFVTLPDLFYSIHPKTSDDVEREVNKLKSSFNRKVREVLARKLMQYLLWREKTYKELKTGQQFKLKYLRQHFNVIKVYLNWLRPYLRNIKRLQMQGTMSNKDVVAAFDTSQIELEILAIKKQYEALVIPRHKELIYFKNYFPCVRVRWNFVAIPQLAYQEEFQRGAIHRGKTIITIEAFVATQKEIDEYKKKLDDEDLDLLTAVDESLLALKEDLDKYLALAGQEEKKEEEDQKRDSWYEPVVGVAKGFKDMTSALKGVVGMKKNKGFAGEKSAAKSLASLDAYLCYKVYKQSHGMMAE
jgi:hypothetical protein